MGRFLVSLFLLAAPAAAHPLDDSKIAISIDGAHLDVRWEISLRDLDAVVDLDRNRDNRISAEEHAAGRIAIETYVRPHLRIDAEGQSCMAEGPGSQAFTERDGGSFVSLRYGVSCARPPSRLDIGFDLFAKEHIPPRALVSVTAGERSWSGALAENQGSLSIDLGRAGEVGFASFFVAGVLHMLEGIDHLLFLCVLLLPLMLAAEPSIGRRLIEAAKILTAFTLAHGLTLWLAALGLVDVPSRLVESVIALSIAATAVDNVVPVLGSRRWLVAFGFGLVHGLGFASALGPLDLPPVELVLSLLAFNLGLEAAQFGVALVVLPLGYLLSWGVSVRGALLPLGSAAAGLAAMLWFAERAFDLSIF
ncbi:MAG: HupE/UreJ family protein [Rhodospirillaceae bacterium]|nr:HupE/UreJ family protein [Rhodospirillaceae bacterium]